MKIVSGLALVLLACSSAFGQSVATPAITPAPGSFQGTTTVTITDATPGVTIYYTTDGSTPTTASAVYAGPFSLSATATVKAIAVFNPNSAVASAAYTIVIPPPPPSCINGNATVASSGIANQSGNFSISFDAIPGANGMDGVAGLSNGAGTGYVSNATAVRFNASGFIDAMNGALFYQSLVPTAYTAGTTYKIVMTVNVPAHTYTVSVNGVVIGVNYAFRPEQATVTALNFINAYAQVGSVKVCNVQIGAALPPPLALVSGSVPNGKAGVLYTTILAAGGGVPPYAWTASGLPTGMTLSATGVLSGTPSAGGPFSVTVTDSKQATVTGNFTLSLTVVPIQHKVSLSWVASPSSGVSGYNVYRDGNKIGNGPATTFTDSSVVSGSNPCFTVRATNSSSESADSSKVCVAIPTP